MLRSPMRTRPIFLICQCVLRTIINIPYNFRVQPAQFGDIVPRFIQGDIDTGPPFEDYSKRGCPRLGACFLEVQRWWMIKLQEVTDCPKASCSKCFFLPKYVCNQWCIMDHYGGNHFAAGSYVARLYVVLHVTPEPANESTTHKETHIMSRIPVAAVIQNTPVAAHQIARTPHQKGCFLEHSG